jgi:hypothetical protein
MPLAERTRLADAAQSDSGDSESLEKLGLVSGPKANTICGTAFFAGA